jgi:transposase
MRKERTHYSREFKLKAVELSNQRGNLTEVALELGISRDTLKRWKKDFKSGKFDVTNSNLKIRSKEEEEIQRLKKELYEIKMERDILKKAVGIFSKSDR